MTEILSSKPFLVAFLAAVTAQAIKVVSFIIVEKRVDYKRFVQPDGSPNMHSAAFSALTISVGLTEGFGSIEFALATCVTAMVTVDTWNVKGAASRQAEIAWLLLERMREKHGGLERSRKALSYTHLDVFSGTALGIVISLLVV